MRYPPLLLALFGLLMLAPLLQASGVPLAGLAFVLTIYASMIYAFRQRRRLMLFLIICAAGAGLLRAAGEIFGRSDLLTSSQAVNCVAMSIVAGALLTEVLKARKASEDLVIGAVCLYLVLGLAWAFFYYWLHLLLPGTILISSSSDQGSNVQHERDFLEMLYFSLSSLSTMGPLDAEKLTMTAKRLAVAEAIMGQLYLAVLISRLVGFSTSGAPTPEAETDQADHPK